MIEELARLVKAFVPGSIEFFWLALGVGLVPLAVPARPLRQFGLFALVVLGAGYFVLSLPWAASLIAAPLYRYPSLPPASLPREGVVLVALDGDYADGRVAETARLYRLLKTRRVIVSGSAPFHEAIVAAGVPPQLILWEHRARNARKQALALPELLDLDKPGAVVLVASPLHMTRARGACQAAGVRVLPSSSARPDASFGRLATIVPAPDALRLSYEALYEYLAIAYYELKGWSGKDGRS